MSFDEFSAEMFRSVALVFVGWLLKTLSDYRQNRTQYDQRLRLEKEYDLYSQMWPTLFELQRDLGTFLDANKLPEQKPTIEAVTASFNDYQSIVRRGEPFFSTSIHGPAREITEACHELFGNLDRLSNPTRLGPDPAAKAQQLEDENETSFELVAANFRVISDEIRKRVGPP